MRQKQTWHRDLETWRTENQAHKAETKWGHENETFTRDAGTQERHRDEQRLAEGPRSLRTKETQKHEQTIIREYPSCLYISVFLNMHVYIFLFFGFSPCWVKRHTKNTVFTQNNPSTLREPAGLKFFLENCASPWVWIDAGYSKLHRWHAFLTLTYRITHICCVCPNQCEVILYPQ